MMKNSVLQAQRLVVKVGSSSVSGENAKEIVNLVDALVGLMHRGIQVVLVSSGAISTGVPFLSITERPDDLATQQAAAAVGQNILVHRYQKALDKYDIVAGQVLLTAGDIENPTNRANAKRAIDRLIELNTLPIINENDTVATHEIRFGDNDRLASLVAGLIGADTLVLLSDIDALYTAPPNEKGAERVAVVSHDDSLQNITIGESQSGWGTGGALTKVAAAKHATAQGARVLLTRTDLFARVIKGEDFGTWFETSMIDT